jgi:O-antigen/teichoic acid export membrane protein
LPDQQEDGEHNGAAQRRQSLGAAIVVLASGTIVAQVVPLLAMPLYTRLYTPAEIGTWMVFTGLAGLAAVLISGRYDLAVVLPPSDSLASRIVLGALQRGAGVAALIALISVAALHASPAVEEVIPRAYVLLVPVMGYALAGTNIGSGWSNRSGRYSRIAASAVGAQICGATVSVVAVAVFDSRRGLIWGSVSGALFGLVAILGTSFRELKRILGNKWSSLHTAVLGDYRDFPLYNLPFSLLTTFGVRLPVYVLSIAGHTASAGYAGLSRAVVFVPITLLSTSLGRVFFRSAAEELGRPTLTATAHALYVTIAAVAAVPFGFFSYWAPDLFRVLFGESWFEAGVYTSLMMPSAFAYLFTAWASRVFEVARRQRHMLIVQVVSDLVIVSVLALMLWMGARPRLVIAVYALLTVVYSGAYLAGILRIVQLDRPAILLIAMRSVLVLGMTTVACAMCSLLFSELVAALVSSALVVAVLWGAVLHSARKYMIQLRSVSA